MGATGRDLHIDAPLSNLVIGYEPTGFIVDQIFPKVNVGKQSDVYYKWDKGNFFRIPNTTRAPKTKGKLVEFNVSSDTYFAKNYALRTEESFEDTVNQDRMLNTRKKDLRATKNLLWLDWENRVASQISSGSNVGSFTTLSGTSQWSDFTNSDPINDVEVGKEAIRSTTGLLTNLMIVPMSVLIQLKQHPDIVDRLGMGGNPSDPRMVTINALESLFGVDKILVGTTIKDTSEEGAGSNTFTDVWGKNVVLAHTTAGPDPDGKDPSLGYSFRWDAPLLGGREMAAEIWNDPDGGNFENRRVQYYQDEKIAASELGYVIASAVA